MTNVVSDIDWCCCTFPELNTSQLFDVVKLRQDIFILEQQCLYPDLEEKDKKCHHLLGYLEKHLVAYLRIVPPELNYPEASIGRVAVAESARKSGLGRILVKQGIHYVQAIYLGCGIRIGAQAHLRDFYSSFGFVEVSGIYDEDGIPHIDMALNSISD